MSHLSDDDVRHIAKLARLTLQESEVPKFSKELSSIIEYIDILQEVDTSNVKPLTMVTGVTNALREDELKQSYDGEALLDNSALPKLEHQIQTPSAHG